jgi:pyruvate dehydrogenase E2 component (dihydrolipoamide acetyltransferase)
MPREIVMPQLSETMTEGDLVAWLVPEGALVRAGDPIAEIETDKATVDSGARGRNARWIVVRAGAQAVAVGQVLAILRGGSATRRPRSRRRSSRRLPGWSRPGAARAAPRRGLARCEPARETNGRAPGLTSRPSAPAPTGASRLTSSVLTDLRCRARASLPVAPDPSRTVERLSRARRTIGERLGAAKREIPHFYLHVDCEIGATMSLREQLNQRSPTRHLSLTDFVVRAAALALRDVPELNASFVDGELRLHEDVESVAVASEAGRSLIVRTPRARSRADLRRGRDLIARARAGGSPHEYQGGTFTVSNLGMHGVDGLYAIVNPPQVAILGVGRAHPRAIARDGSVVVERVSQLTLSADHRVVDGALGARLLGVIRARLEDPLTLLV